MELREPLQQRTEPLALEAGPDEQDHPGVRRQSEGIARRPPEAPAIVRMEALEIDAVVHEAHPFRWRTVEPLDLRLAPAGDGDDVPRRPKTEDPPLEGAHEPMVRADSRPSPAHCRQIGSVHAFAGAVDVLLEPAL